MCAAIGSASQLRSDISVVRYGNRLVTGRGGKFSRLGARMPLWQVRSAEDAGPTMMFLRRPNGESRMLFNTG